MKHTITIGYRTPEGLISNVDTEVEGTSEVALDLVVAPGADQEFTVPFNNDAVVASLIVADGDISIKNSSTEAAAFNVAANVPIVWTGAIGGDSKFVADVTSLFITNGGDGPVNFKLRVLLNVVVED